MKSCDNEFRRDFVDGNVVLLLYHSCNRHYAGTKDRRQDADHGAE